MQPNPADQSATAPPTSVPASAGTSLSGGDVLQVLLVALQFAGIVVLVRAFELETRSLFHVLCLAWLGFLIHAWLPVRHRLWFFGALSVASILLVLGLRTGGMLLALGGLLIGLAHLPVRFGVRVVLILLVAAALMVLRSAPWPSSLPAIAWPILGSLFMFRMVLYLYSLRYKDAPAGPAWAVAYFFMLPNVCFPLFPVVDYKTFVRTHFDAERFQVYDTGIRWMLRGVVHLLLYRLIYYDLALGGLYVNDLGDVVRHIVTTFFLYVKVSGQFHLIVGLLHLFGFRLPETNHLYFLASSINDFWRRINIYWKDFMMKVVYYPTFFRLRRFGNTPAIVASTLIVFFATWALHAYQFYWIAGSRLIAKRDIIFWGFFAALVLGSTLRELRPGRKLSRPGRGWNLRRAVSTVTTFTVIAVLWSLWNAESARNWMFMWTRVRYSDPGDWLLLGGLLAAGLLIAGFGWGAPSLAAPPQTPEPIGKIVKRAGFRLAGMAAVLLFLVPAVQKSSIDLARISRHLRGRGLALLDAALELQGYYEALTSKDVRLSEPWRPPHHFDDFTKTAAWAERHDFMLDSVVPLASITFQGAPFHTNRWGMRDRDFELAKPAGTYRIAVMGASDVTGWGVPDGHQFSTIVAQGLDSIARERGRHVEVLNFSITAISLAQQVYGIEKLARRFSPDLILLTAYPDNDIWLLQRQATRLATKGIAIPDPELDRLMKRAMGSDLHGDPRNLRPEEEAIDRRLFEWARQLGDSGGAKVALLVLRSPGKLSPGNYVTTVRAADTAGLPWIDCTDVWRGLDPLQYRVSADDAHPNSAGHEIIGACVLKQLVRSAPALGIPVGGTADVSTAQAPIGRVP
jgi:hypothetical protein